MTRSHYVLLLSLSLFIYKQTNDFKFAVVFFRICQMYILIASQAVMEKLQFVYQMYQVV